MGILDRLLRRNKDLSQTDRYRKVSNEPTVSQEQQDTSRRLMEEQMTDSRERREAEDAAAAEAAEAGENGEDKES
jgi:hypothetical protein